jgi:acyl carrier protein
MSHNKTASEIETWLINALSESLGIDSEQIETDVSWESYGLDSSTAVVLSGDLQEWLGCELDPTIFFDYPNIEEMTKYLVSI